MRPIDIRKLTSRATVDTDKRLSLDSDDGLLLTDQPADAVTEDEIKSLPKRAILAGDERLTLGTDNELVMTPERDKPLSEVEMKALTVRDALVTDRRLTLDENDNFVMTNQPDNSAIGTAASKDHGTALGEIPLNSDLGSASLKDTGTDFDQVPLNTNIVYPVATVADLRNLEPTVDGQRFNVTSYDDGWAATVRGPVGGGEFVYDASDTTSVDDGGSVFVTATGERIKRIKKEFVYIEDFGATGSSAQNATTIFNSALLSAVGTGCVVRLFDGTFTIDPDLISIGTLGLTTSDLDDRTIGIIGIGNSSKIALSSSTGVGIEIFSETATANRNVVLKDFSVSFSSNDQQAFKLDTISGLDIENVNVYGKSYRDCRAFHFVDVIMLAAKKLYIRDLAGDFGEAFYCENPNSLTVGNYTFEDVLCLFVNKGFRAPSSGRVGEILNSIRFSNFKIYDDRGTLGSGDGGFSDDGTYFTERVGFDVGHLTSNVTFNNCHVEYKSGHSAIRLDQVRGVDINGNMLSGQTAGDIKYCVNLIDRDVGTANAILTIGNNTLQAADVGIYSGKGTEDINISPNKVFNVTTEILRHDSLRNAVGLNDYEKGFFTPVIEGTTTAGSATYTTQYGQYSRNKDTVTFFMQVDFTGHDGAGFMEISGLPEVTSGNNLQILNIMSSNLTYAGSLVAATSNLTNRIKLWQNETALPPDPVNMQSAASIYISGSYLVR